MGQAAHLPQGGAEGIPRAREVQKADKEEDTPDHPQAAGMRQARPGLPGTLHGGGLCPAKEIHRLLSHHPEAV